MARVTNIVIDDMIKCLQEIKKDFEMCDMVLDEKMNTLRFEGIIDDSEKGLTIGDINELLD